MTAQANDGVESDVFFVGVLFMKRNTIALIRLSDIIFILILVIFSVSFFFLRHSGNKELIAVVYIDKKQVQSFNLNSLQEPVVTPFEGNGYEIIVRAEKGKIRFESSDCPDKICVNSGWLTSAGDTAVCLPARVSIVVSGRKELDAITG